MDETTLLIDVLESRRKLAQSVLDANAADALGESADPADIAYYQAEVADSDATKPSLENLARLGRQRPRVFGANIFDMFMIATLIGEEIA